MTKPMVRTECINRDTDRELFAAMYRSYCMELGIYSPRCARKVRDREIDEMFANPDLEMWFVSVDGQPIGFALVGVGRNKHPVSDAFMAEFYIRPDYRRQRYGFEAAKSLIEARKGKWCMFILKGNKRAEIFWKCVFDACGYEDISDVFASDIFEDDVNFRFFDTSLT